MDLVYAILYMTMHTTSAVRTFSFSQRLTEMNRRLALDPCVELTCCFSWSVAFLTSAAARGLKSCAALLQLHSMSFARFLSASSGESFGGACFCAIVHEVVKLGNQVMGYSKAAALAFLESKDPLRYQVLAIFATEVDPKWAVIV
jgi:hypothetical protein